MVPTEDLKRRLHQDGHLHTKIAQDRVHELNAGYSLNRFRLALLLMKRDLEQKPGYRKCFNKLPALWNEVSK
ncbi:MAG: hypothetical protein CM1200mP13_16290 [Candidatus Pelagibacterales bacterium]|nr:MAG: hypothetical protein CM1200mP13_16290 [Pelagibacterales bacterium]